MCVYACVVCVWCVVRVCARVCMRGAWCVPSQSMDMQCCRRTQRDTTVARRSKTFWFGPEREFSAAVGMVLRDVGVYGRVVMPRKNWREGGSWKPQSESLKGVSATHLSPL